jgi:hypothetical protein
VTEVGVLVVDAGVVAELEIIADSLRTAPIVEDLIRQIKP